MTAAQHVAEIVGIFLVVFAGSLAGTKYSSVKSPPGTRREWLDVHTKRLPVAVFAALILVGIALLALANL